MIWGAILTLKTLWKMVKNTFSWLSNAIADVYAFLCGIIATFFGYFIPVKDFIHLLLLFFFIDIVFGFWAAKKLRKERFEPRIIWEKTMPRVLLTIILMLMTYMWDTVYSQDTIVTYKWIGWFISGILISSIARNGYKITQWGVFTTIEETIKQKLPKKKQQSEDYKDCHNE